MFEILALFGYFLLHLITAHASYLKHYWFVFGSPEKKKSQALNNRKYFQTSILIFNI